jgi:CDP-glucose 4,6-dehydratase
VEWTKEYLDGADMLEVMDKQIREFFVPSGMAEK